MPQHKGPLFSPLHWQILLWYHARPTQYAETDPVHASSSAVQEYTEQLLRMALIEYNTEWYKTTERGRTLVEHLLSLPLPIQEWRIPNAANQ